MTETSSQEQPNPTGLWEIAARSDRTYRLKVAVPSELVDEKPDLVKLQLGGFERWLVIQGRGQGHVPVTLTLNEEELNRIVEGHPSPEPAVTELAGSQEPATASKTPSTSESTAKRPTTTKASVTPLGGKAKSFDANFAAVYANRAAPAPRRARDPRAD
jgi:hypothetical protein